MVMSTFDMLYEASEDAGPREYRNWKNMRRLDWDDWEMFVKRVSEDGNKEMQTKGIEFRKWNI